MGLGSPLTPKVSVAGWLLPQVLGQEGAKSEAVNLKWRSEYRDREVKSLDSLGWERWAYLFLGISGDRKAGT